MAWIVQCVSISTKGKIGKQPETYTRLIPRGLLGTRVSVDDLLCVLRIQNALNVGQKTIEATNLVVDAIPMTPCRIDSLCVDCFKVQSFKPG
ncbi:hypothetical protein D3C71_1955600 [compost metagenome]